MKTTNNFAELAALNLSAIHSEKDELNTIYRKLVKSCTKNPNYYNLVKNRMVTLLDEITALEKEAKKCRRYIRKANAAA